MESTDSSTGSQQPHLPPGFRFHPTDEELVVHYLKRKASSAPLPVAIIAEVDLYKFDPWELPAKASFGEQEWYFFSPRDRKYPNGARPNRAATSGYWKATGTDKPVLSSGGNQKVGVKKALVFYGGKPPKGIKTNWIMHEYRLADNKNNNNNNNKTPGCDLGHKKNSLRLDDWVLCRIYQKNNSHRPMEHDREDSMEDMIGGGGGHLRFGQAGQQSLRLHLAKADTSFGSLLENEQNLLEGIMNNEHAGINSNVVSQLASSSNSKPEFIPLVSANAMSSSLCVKRPFSSLIWNNDEDHDQNRNASSNKRSELDCSNNEATKTDGNCPSGSSSLATLLSQLPQSTTPLHQQTMLGSLGDGIFRSPYQLPGMNNWYS